jgi:hypothetical protein
VNPSRFTIRITAEHCIEAIPKRSHGRELLLNVWRKQRIGTLKIPVDERRCEINRDLLVLCHATSASDVPRR